MGIISPDMRAKKKRQLIHEREARAAQKRDAIAAFCSAENIDQLVAMVQQKAVVQFNRSGTMEVRSISIEVNLSQEVVGNWTCEKTLYNALREIEPSVYKVSLEEYAPHGGSNRSTGILVQFDPPLS